MKPEVCKIIHACCDKHSAMFKLLAISFFSLVYSVSFAQHKQISIYLNGQFTNTLYDKTAGNNPWAVGVGVQGYFNSKSTFRPTIDATTDIYLADNKVMVINPDGTSPEDLGGVVNLFGGVSYLTKNQIYWSLVMGPSILNGRTCFGIKPSFGFYFSARERWTGKISYINIFNRDKASGHDFMSISLALGVRLY